MSQVITTGISLPVRLLEEIRQAAREGELSVSGFLRLAARRALEEQRQPEARDHEEQTP